MRLLEWEAKSPAVTGRAYKRVTGRTVELGLATAQRGLPPGRAGAATGAMFTAGIVLTEELSLVS
jgi:hypothetical protein